MVGRRAQESTKSVSVILGGSFMVNPRLDLAKSLSELDLLADGARHCRHYVWQLIDCAVADVSVESRLTVISTASARLH